MTDLRRMIPGKMYSFNERSAVARFVKSGAIYPEFSKMSHEVQNAIVRQTQDEGYESIAELLFDTWIDKHMNDDVPATFIRSKNL